MKRKLSKPLVLTSVAGGAGCVVVGVFTGNVALVGVAAMGLCLVVNRWSNQLANDAGGDHRGEDTAICGDAPRRPKRVVEPVSAEDPEALVRQMLEQGRYALLLRSQVSHMLSAEQRQQATDAQQAEMALVPSGVVALLPPTSEEELPDAGGRQPLMAQVPLDAVFLDRFPVTNRQYQQFVDAGGYRDMSLWYEEAWAALLSFVDATGEPSPADWRDGQYADGLDEHPVVGVSWYEAMAYARWVGKRLPSDPEWVKAGVWPVSAAAGLPQQQKFPWGNTFEKARAHTWESGASGAVSVSEYPAGMSPGGVYQLIGNVWEWMYDNFGMWHPGGTRASGDEPLKSIRGGAYDTYFESQLNCQFASGENPLSRKANIGFRCALAACDLAPSQGESQGGLEELVEPGADAPLEEALS